jgi:hypothetical protein
MQALSGSNLDAVATTDDPKRTAFAERAWRAYLALPRDARGKPPSVRGLEFANGLSAATLHKIFRGRMHLRHDTMPKVAAALSVSVEYLVDGKGPAPKLSGRWEPRPGTETGIPTEHRVVEYDERYPNRAKAIDAARLIDASETAIDHVRSWQLDAPEDPPAKWWLDQIVAADDKLKRGLPL